MRTTLKLVCRQNATDWRCLRERANVQKRSTQSLRENRSENVDGWSWDENAVGHVDEAGLSTECHGLELFERERDLPSRRNQRSRRERIAARTSRDGVVRRTPLDT